MSYLYLLDTNILNVREFNRIRGLKVENWLEQD